MGKYKHKYYDGRQKGTMGAGVTHSDVDRVMTLYRELNTDEARAAFADKMVVNLSRRLDHTWPILYRLLEIIRDQKVYEQAAYIESKKTYPSFEAYFEATVAQPFAKWKELEDTYKFVSTCRPDLLGAPLPEATQARKARDTEAEQQAVREMAAAVEEGGVEAGRTHSEAASTQPRNEETGTFGAKPGSVSDNVNNGNRASYLIARIKGIAATPTHPNHARATQALAGLQSGEIRSARAAGILAGLVKVPTPLELLRQAWRKASAEERTLFLSEVAPTERDPS